MNKSSFTIKKILILVLILAVPGFLYYLLTAKGKNRYKPLAIYGPKEVAKTGHKFHGKYIPDTIYHKLPNFEFTNQEGKAVKLNDFDYKVFVVNLFYTQCPDVCSKVNKNIDRLAGAFRKNRMVKFVSITVNPEFDNTARLQSYAKPWGYAADKWMFLRGDTATTYNFARNGLLVNAVKMNNNFVFDSKLVLIDAEKRIRGYYDGTNLQEIVKLNDEIKVQIAEELRKIKAPN
ncbi:SCO family protein [uncultured Mucilaginibacter sp.]|uniref:SCO family protein n=1 Tax=uncultured Mucilaginibacter sp. TaxID=797541 RepID=UPI0025F3A80D|nr:SCO family protein [uncultured Mucilaginibacter sp.]